ncbi:MAG: PqqD family protein [Pyrinomonadaceae bacterium]
MSTPFTSTITISPDVMVRQVGEESVLLDLKTERYLGLDDVSSRMWQVLTNGASIDSAYQTLLAEFDVNPERLRNDLDEFVQELLKLELVQINNQP